MHRRGFLTALLALSVAPRAWAQPRRRAPVLRAVFHLGAATRADVVRGLTNMRNALAALGDEPADFVLVVHGAALAYFLRGGEDPVTDELAAVMATGRASWRACARTLEEHRWQPRDLLPGGSTVPSGTLEVLRLHRWSLYLFTEGGLRERGRRSGHRCVLRGRRGATPA
jgi:intracellular sulfur oxidation DsrE/DsrF family protein